MVDRFKELVRFLEHLEDKEIVYELNKIREGILVEVFTENKIYEIEYVIYPEETRIEIEIFRSEGRFLKIQRLKSYLENLVNISRGCLYHSKK